jgi:hypothetical protein
MLLAQALAPLLDKIPGGLAGAAAAGAVALIILFLLLRRMFGGKKKSADVVDAGLRENLADYPPLKPGGGDRRLLVEGVPVRLRLVVLAPAGTSAEIEEGEVDGLLDKVLSGLGAIRAQDKPRVRLWPTQTSNEGFANKFHNNTIIPEGRGEMSPWTCVAGRARLGKTQVMVGLAMQAVKPNVLGRKTVEADQWAQVLRVRVRAEE